MRKLILAAMLPILVAALFEASAAAEKGAPSIEPIEMGALPLLFGAPTPMEECQVENLNAPYWSITNFIYPPEEYAYTFDPLATCSVCSYEFKVNQIHVILQAKAACTVRLSVGLQESVLASPGCYAPGPLVCASAIYQVDLPVGVWNIAIPLECDCVSSEGKYLLEVYFMSRSCTPDNLGLILDQGPAQLCLNWNNYGEGWYDLLGVSYLARADHPICGCRMLRAAGIYGAGDLGCDKGALQGLMGGCFKIDLYRAAM